MTQKDYRLAAIMFTDIYSFSKMMEKDEAGTLALLHTHNEIIESVVQSHGGEVIKTIGDAYLVDYKNTVDALKSALEIQRQLYSYNVAHENLQLLVRIGIHLGDIYFFERDAFGDGINIASRLQSTAHPGCICVSEDVYHQVLNKVDFDAVNLGRVNLKNISKEIRAYEIHTENLQFVPEHARPTQSAPGKAEAAIEAEAPAVITEESPSASQGQEKSANSSGQGAPSSGEEGQPSNSIKRSILNDIKVQGRRLTVEEARSKYAMYGEKAEDAILDLLKKGMLVDSPKRSPGGSYFGFTPAPGSRAERFLKIGEQLADEIATSIEDSVSKTKQGAYPSPSPGSGYNSGYGEYRYNRHAERERRRELKRQYKEEFKYGESDENYQNFLKDHSGESFPQYQDRLSDQATHSWVGFVFNGLFWAAASVGFFYIQKTYTPEIPWAMIPVAGWAVGVFQNFTGAIRKSAHAVKAKLYQNLEGEPFDLLKRLNRAKDSIWSHAASTLSVSILLGVINVFTLTYAKTDFPWAIFPVGAMVLSFLAHAPVSFSRIRKLKAQFKAALGGAFSQGQGDRGEGIPAGPYRDIYAVALRVKAEIVSQSQKAGKKSASFIDKDTINTLDEYVGQVKLLAERTAEVDRILDSIPMGNLATDKENLARRKGETQDGRLLAEYEKSIGEIERQEKSYQDLKNQRDILRLKLSSSVNSLTQFRMEAAKLSTLSELEGNVAFTDFKEKTSQLSTYLEDLRQGYAESETDPFAELERNAREGKLPDSAPSSTSTPDEAAH
jgi:class 3 adenylate cyclase